MSLEIYGITSGGQRVALRCTAQGELLVSGGTGGGGGVGTATITSVAASATSVQLLAVNANRRRIVIVNDSSATMFLAFAATASTTAHTYELFGGDTYESPGDAVYSGVISAIWTSATGAARITEMT